MGTGPDTAPATPADPARTTQGVLLGFGSFGLFSLSDASVKLIAGAIAPMQSAFIGALFGCLLLPFMLRKGEGLMAVFRTVSRPLWLVRFVAYPVGVIGSVTAFTHLSMAEAMVLMFLEPTFVTLLSIVFLKERVGARRWLAIALGFAGVLIVLRPGFRELSIGHLGAICAALGGAVSIVVFRALGDREGKASLVGAGPIGAVVVCGALSLQGFVWPSAHQWLLLAGYGLLATLANVLASRASTLAAATLVGATQYSQMIWAIALDWALFGTRPDAPMLLGAVFILASGLLTVLHERRHAPHWPPAALGGHRPATALLTKAAAAAARRPSAPYTNPPSKI